MKQAGRRRFTRWLMIAAAGSACAARDSGIGLAFNYQSLQFTKIVELWLDDGQVIGRRGSTLHLTERSPAHEALVAPEGIHSAALELRAVWRYLPVGSPEDLELLSLPDDRPPWRAAQARVSLREILNPNDLSLLRNEPRQYRLEVTLIFKEGHLEVRTQVLERGVFSAQPR